LELESEIGATLGAIQDLKDELLSAESWKPSFTRRDEIWHQLDAALAPWNGLAQAYQGFVDSGGSADAAKVAAFRGNVAALRAKTGLSRLLGQVSEFAADEARKQRWIQIALVIGISIVAAVAGGGLGGYLGAGFEAFVFTSLDQGLLARD